MDPTRKSEYQLVNVKQMAKDKDRDVPQKRTRPGSGGADSSSSIIGQQIVKRWGPALGLLVAAITIAAMAIAFGAWGVGKHTDYVLEREDVKHHKARVTSLEERLKSAETRLAVAEGKIAKNEAALKDLVGSIDEVKAMLDDNRKVQHKLLLRVEGLFQHYNPRRAEPPRRDLKLNQLLQSCVSGKNPGDPTTCFK